MANISNLDSAQLLSVLQRVPAFYTIKTWWLAYSGGVDSRVLLHLLAQLNLPVRAVYIDHGLQAISKHWAQHCQQICASLNIPLSVIAVDASAQRGESPEAAARRARYQALASVMAAGDCMLTAQHADDQAETFLLQLMRGAGAAGLSAMPFVQAFDTGWLVRPLLGFSQQTILDIARVENLQWVDDPSNSDTRFDRNYLRQKILPDLTARWPQTTQLLSRAAQQQAENQSLLATLAAQDLQQAEISNVLPVEKLLTLDAPRQRNALRYWLEQNTVRMPSRAIMQQILSQLLHSREDAEASVSWDNNGLYSYRQHLYLQEKVVHDAAQVLSWDGKQPLLITSLQQQLVLQTADDTGLLPEIIGKQLQIKFRQGGEKIKPDGQAHTHTLKNLFQQHGVLPWLRDRVPLLYLGDELIAVCGYWIADTYAVKSGAGWVPCLLAVLEKKQKT